MNVDDAAYAVVHGYGGGSESLAPRLGISAAVLRGKVNRNNDRNVLSLREAVDITVLSGDLRILEAFAAEANCRLVPIDHTETGSVLDLVMARAAREGELASVVHQSLDDGVITPNEWDAIQAAGGNVQATMLALLRKLHSMKARAPATE